MNRPIADQAARQRAVELDASCIVKAPAGSGKTSLLIRRFLRLLARVDHPEEIVAVTFTNKAAGEMQGRILGALEGAASGRIAEDDNAAAADALARAALARDAERGWDLLQNPGRLRIQTIDALCAHLTRRMPILARFGAQPDTLEDAAVLYREAALAAFDEIERDGEWAPSVALLLSHLDNDLPRARDLLARMLARRDQWLRHVAGLRRADLEGALRNLAETTLGAARAALAPDEAAELCALIAFAAEQLEREGRDSGLRACRGLRELPRAAAGELGKWRAIADFTLTQAGGWRRKADVRIGFPAPGRAGAEAGRRRAMKDRYEVLLARLGENDVLHQCLTEVRWLPPPAYTDAQWQVVEALCRLLILADARLRILFAQRNQIDFPGVAMAAAAALGAADEPTDLALHLDYAIRHVLVDEFQDISINQYELLCRLTAGWAPGDGHTLFLVGDPMQSIYRFREAEVGLFVDTWAQRRLAQVPLETLEITVNFRSTRGLVEWVNGAFARVLPPGADAARGAVTYSAAQAFHPETELEPVTVHAIPGADRGLEARLVRDLVAAARRSDAEGSVAILARSRSLLPRIIAELQRDGLRFRAVEIEGLGQRPAIQDLLALTRALHHFADRIAWLAILRAPWCGLTLADLLALAGDADDRALWDCMRDPVRAGALGADGQRRLLRLCESLEAAFSRRGRLSLRRWVESTWLSLGGPGTLADATDLENARTFFELIEEFDAGGDLRDAARFADRVAALFAAPDVGADDRLQVMTIHRAKGLEFDSVIVPGLDRAPRRDEPGLLLWAERPAADGGQDLLLAPIREAGADESPIYACLRELLREKDRYEDGRLLYVAATRARKRLHLVAAAGFKADADGGAVSAPRSGSLLAQLWPAVREEFEKRIAGMRESAADYAAREASGERGICRTPLDWRPPEPAPAAAFAAGGVTAGPGAVGQIEFEWAGETVRHIGTAYHLCLQRATREGDARAASFEEPQLRRILQQLGTPAADLDWAAAQLALALANTFADERGRWLLADGHAEARSEYALSGIHDGRLVNVKIDRTFVGADGVRWIVDYKTSRHEGADADAFLDRERERYRGQLHRYADLMRRIDARPIRLGLYFPLLKGWREWPAD